MAGLDCGLLGLDSNAKLDLCFLRHGTLQPQCIFQLGTDIFNDRVIPVHVMGKLILLGEARNIPKHFIFSETGDKLSWIVVFLGMALYSHSAFSS